MKKTFTKFLAALMLLAIFTPSMIAVGQTTTTYTFTAKTWTATSGGSAANWTSGQDGAGFTSGQGVQVTTSATGANATSPTSFTDVSKIVVTYCTNASKGTGAIKVQVGSGTEQSFTVTKPSSGGTTLKTTEFNYSTTETGDVKITVDCTQNSIYIYSIAITVSGGAPVPSISASPTTITWADSPINQQLSQVITLTSSNISGDIVTSTTIGSLTWNTQNETATLTYTPTTVGDFSGTVSFANGEATATVTVTGSAYDPSNVDTYEQYTGTIVEGDYVIYNTSGAMKNEISSNRFANQSVEIEGTTISNPNASAIWHIAPIANTDYWSIYNVSAGKYAGGTSNKNQGALYDDTTNDLAKWTITYNNGYVFHNYGRSQASSDSGNAYLRQNSTSGWGTYTSSYGSAPQLYKKVIANQVAMPTFSVEAGTYYEAQSVTLSCATTGATIYYTTDGTTPSVSSTAYTSAISVSETMTIKAIAIKSDMTDSDVATATYTISLPLSTMDQIYAAATSAGTTAANVNVAFGNWVVSGVSGSNAFVTDNNGKGFIIYTSNHGFAVNDKLSGTVTETPLKLYKGSAEFTNLTTATEGLTVSNDGTITVITNKTIADLSGVNTGAVITLNDLTFDGTNLSDGTNSIKPYNTLYNSMSFTSGKTYNVTGVYQQFDSTKEILPRSAADIVEVVVTTPSITVSPATANHTATDMEGTLDITYANLTISDTDDFGIEFYDAPNGSALSSGNEPDWIEVIVAEQDPQIGEGYVVSYTMDENEDEARTAYFKVFAMDDEDFVYSNLVTVTQAAPIIDYATLPFTWDNTTTPQGITLNNVGWYTSSSPYIKMNSSNGEGTVVLKLNTAPGIIAFDIKGNPSSGTTSTGTFTVATSANGTDYTTLASYSSIVNKVQTMYFTNISADTRYIKWSYTKNNNGNVALGNFNIQSIANQSATITPESNHVYVVNSGATLILDGDYSGTLTNADNLIIEDGGELITHNAVQATVKKNIEEATNWGTATTYDADAWYFIASPVNGAAFPTGTFDDQDIYQLDWANSTWLNLQNDTHSSLLAAGFQRGTGYLYASEAGNTLSVAGEIQPLSGDNDATVTLATTGWNLIGNPLTCKVTVNKAFSELNNGSSVTSKSAGSAINPYQGIAVYGDAGTTVTFTKAATQNAAAPSNTAALQMTLAKNVTSRGTASTKVVDNAVVNFNSESSLPKFTMLEGSAKLYFPMEDADYAIVSSDGHGSMPVNFKAKEMGRYTISVETEGIDMSYLHLIDRLTGEDINLLLDNEYSFIASNNDSEERFILSFTEKGYDAHGNEIFVYQSGNDLIVNGEGELQIFDVMGRMVKNTTINGVEAIAMPQGVYIFRLNGNVQKIVVR